MTWQNEPRELAAVLAHQCTVTLSTSHCKGLD